MYDERRGIWPGLSLRVNFIVPFFVVPVFARWPAIVPATIGLAVLFPIFGAFALFRFRPPVFRLFDLNAGCYEHPRIRRAFQFAIRVSIIFSIGLAGCTHISVDGILFDGPRYGEPDAGFDLG